MKQAILDPQEPRTAPIPDVCEYCLAPYEYRTDGLRPGWEPVCGCGCFDPDDRNVHLAAGEPFYLGHQ